MNSMDIKFFRKNITFIMQDNCLQSLLTVNESINFAVKLKIGNELSQYKKCEKINLILNSFGLKDVQNELIGNLSGGQQKRVAIALEIVDDPLIIFLDEPTTGLDSVSSNICLNVLKNLTKDGKTVICTIHQPSMQQLSMFDHIYAISNGKCVYQGSGMNLVSFLNDCNLLCPSNYNPADFLLEVVTGVYGERNNILIEKIENGKIEKYRKSIISDLEPDHLELANVLRYSPTNFSQLYELIVRNFIIISRNKSFFMLRIFMHIFVGVLLGSVYYNIGNNAEHILNNFRLLFVVMCFLVYTSYYSIMVTFPINFPLIKRETFNRWYSPAKWFIGLIVCDFPITVLTNFLFIIPVYYMTSQPLELFRFNTLALILILTSFTSQAFGLIAGSFTGLKVRSIFNDYQ